MPSVLAAPCPFAAAASPEGAVKCKDRKRKVINFRKGKTRHCIKVATTRASGLGLGASGVGVGLLNQF
jgi:hypothetical protein